MTRTFRVVVADDAADMRLLVSLALETSERFHVVGEAANGQEAVDLARAVQPDLTVLDLSMPVMDGLEALPLIRQSAPGCTVVVMSGLDEAVYGNQARASGAAEFVGKGLLPEQLVQRLLELLDPELERGQREALRSFPAEITSPGAAREFVRKLLTDWGRSDLVDIAELLTSELVSNAVVHANAAPDVSVTFDADQVRVSVIDRGGGALVMRDVSEFDVNGRGLHIVESLAAKWGTTSDGSNKVVWFELA